MNMNEFAKQIASSEGKVQSLSIAQIKEVIGLVADALYSEWSFVEDTGDTDIYDSLVKLGRRRDGQRTLGKGRRK